MFNWFYRVGLLVVSCYIGVMLYVNRGSFTVDQFGLVACVWWCLFGFIVFCRDILNDIKDGAVADLELGKKIWQDKWLESREEFRRLELKRCPRAGGWLVREWDGYFLRDDTDIRRDGGFKDCWDEEAYSLFRLRPYGRVEIFVGKLEWALEQAEKAIARDMGRVDKDEFDIREVATKNAKKIIDGLNKNGKAIGDEFCGIVDDSFMKSLNILMKDTNLGKIYSGNHDDTHVGELTKKAFDDACQVMTGANDASVRVAVFDTGSSGVHGDSRDFTKPGVVEPDVIAPSESGKVYQFESTVGPVVMDTRGLETLGKMMQFAEVDLSGVEGVQKFMDESRIAADKVSWEDSQKAFDNLLDVSENTTRFVEDLKKAFADESEAVERAKEKAREFAGVDYAKMGRTLRINVTTPVAPSNVILDLGDDGKFFDVEKPTAYDSMIGSVGSVLVPVPESLASSGQLESGVVDDFVAAYDDVKTANPGVVKIDHTILGSLRDMSLKAMDDIAAQENKKVWDVLIAASKQVDDGPGPSVEELEAQTDCWAAMKELNEKLIDDLEDMERTNQIDFVTSMRSKELSGIEPVITDKYVRRARAVDDGPLEQEWQNEVPTGKVKFLELPVGSKFQYGGLESVFVKLSNLSQRGERVGLVAKLEGLDLPKFLETGDYLDCSHVFCAAETVESCDSLVVYFVE